MLQHSGMAGVRCSCRGGGCGGGLRHRQAEGHRVSPRVGCGEVLFGKGILWLMPHAGTAMIHSLCLKW